MCVVAFQLRVSQVCAQGSEKKLFQLYKQVIYSRLHDPALRFCAKVKKTPEETLDYSSIKDVFSEYETIVATEKEAEAEASFLLFDLPGEGLEPQKVEEDVKEPEMNERRSDQAPRLGPVEVWTQIAW